MKALDQASELAKIGDQIAALKSVLRGAHAPCTAIVETARQLRAMSVALDLLADDLDKFQSDAARQAREQFA